MTRRIDLVEDLPLEMDEAKRLAVQNAAVVRAAEFFRDGLPAFQAAAARKAAARERAERAEHARRRRPRLRWKLVRTR